MADSPPTDPVEEAAKQAIPSSDAAVAVQIEDVGTVDFHPLVEDESELPIQQIGQIGLIWRRFRRHKVALVGAVLLLLITVIAIIGPYITPEGPIASFPTQIYWPADAPPNIHSWAFLMGTDDSRKSVLSLVLLGAKTSLLIGVCAAAIATILGILIGSIAGYFGGFADSVMMRVTDVFLTLPFLPLLLLLSKYFANGGIWFIVIIFGVLGWPGVARLIRSYYLTFRQQEFVEAARAVGVSSPRIIFRHILPNALSPVIVSFTLAVAGFIGAEAAIDFLGLGLKAPNISWGLAISGSNDSILTGNWWSIVFPGTALLLTVLAVNFLGDGLRDALDVKAKVSE